MSPPSVYGFSQADAVTLKRIAQANALAPRGNGQRLPFDAGLALPAAAWIMEAKTEIVEWNGTTAQSGTAYILKRNSSDQLDRHENANSVDVEHTVHNLMQLPVRAGQKFLGVRAMDGTIWVAHIFEVGGQYIFKADGAITARSGTTIGTGTADLFYASGSTLTEFISNVTIKNWAGSAIATGTYGWCALHAYDQNFYVVSEDCA